MSASQVMLSLKETDNCFQNEICDSCLGIVCEGEPCFLALNFKIFVNNLVCILEHIRNKFGILVDYFFIRINIFSNHIMDYI